MSFNKYLAILFLLISSSAYATSTTPSYAGWNLVSIASTTSTGITSASAVIDNTTTKALDAEIFCHWTTGSGTAFSTDTIVIYGYGYNGASTKYSDTVTGSSATITLTNPPNMPPPFICSTPAATTTYECGPFYLSQMFPILPDKWGIAYTNNSGPQTTMGSCWYQTLGITNQ